MFARPESIAEFAQVNELSRLRFANDKLRAALDGFVVIGETVGKRVPGIVGPFDDFEKLAFKIIDQSHKKPFVCSVQRMIADRSRAESIISWQNWSDWDAYGCVPGKEETTAERF